MLLGKVTIAPRLVLQARRFVGVDRARIPAPSTMRRHCLASVAALLQPRTVIAPIPIFVGAIVTPRLILHRQASSVLTIALSIRATYLKLSAKAGDPTAIAAATTAHTRQTATRGQVRLHVKPYHPRCTISERRIDGGLPQIGWFEHGS
jgi:hypothetical protein